MNYDFFIQWLSIVGPMLAATWYMTTSIKRDIEKDIYRHDLELKDMRKEFSKIHALWADLLKQIHEIKLEVVKKFN